MLLLQRGCERHVCAQRLRTVSSRYVLQTHSTLSGARSTGCCLFCHSREGVLVEEATDSRCGVPVHVLEVMAGSMLVIKRHVIQTTSSRASGLSQTRGGGHLYVESQVESRHCSGRR